MSLMNTAIQMAKDKENELFETDCLEILESVYKGRMDVMKPKTIFQKVWDLMGVIADPDEQAITRAVNNWINSGIEYQSLFTL